MDGFILPKYNGQSLLNVPATILSLFGLASTHQTLLPQYYENVKGAKKVILLLIDGLGDDLFQNEALKHPFFKKIVEKGIYLPATSIFPSSTPPASNTLNSGLSPLEHGLPEWYVYFQELDCIVQSLPFIPARKEDASKTLNPPKSILFDQETIYSKLEKAGIPSWTLCSKYYSDSFYNKRAFAGSKTLGYSTIADFLVSLRQKINQDPKPAYYYGYYGAVDAAEHQFGTTSEVVKAEISSLADMLEKELVNKVDPEQAAQTALLITADHGLVNVDLSKTIYLDEIAGWQDNFKRSVDGKQIIASGSGRDLYLYIKEEKLGETLKILTDKLKNKAVVIKTEDLIKKGVFGSGKMHPEFKNRIGNLSILPLGNNTVWSKEITGEKVDLIGQHGGLSKEEMMIPFISIRLSEMQS